MQGEVRKREGKSEKKRREDIVQRERERAGKSSKTVQRGVILREHKMCVCVLGGS